MGLFGPGRGVPHRLSGLPILVCTLSAVLLAEPAQAALTITKTTWNVIGLDSNNVTVGPNIFPVAASVCNTGPSTATNLTTAFIWDSSNGFINLTGPATVNRGTLAAGACLEAYYWVAVTRTPAAYESTRRYHIAATADAGLSTSTPVRELFVERLISQNRNTSLTPSGPTTVVVGQTYTYTWVGDTATQGYEQVTNFLTFDDRIFRVLSVQSTYAAGRSPVGGMYNDACSWNDDPSSAAYKTCAGTGKAGGAVTMSVTVQIIGTGSTSLAGAIYDFSGSSFHYNADFGRNSLPVTAIPAPPAPPAPSADLSITKTDGIATVTPGGSTLYTIVVTNAGPNAVTGATVTDAAPSGVTFGTWTCTGTGGGVCPASGTGNLNVSVTLPVAATVTFGINATVNAGASGSITNTAAVTPPSGILDPNPGNNTATDTDTLAAVTARADLSVTKTNGVSTLTPGGTTVYTLVVTNSGPDAVTGATVTDVAPAGVTFGAWTCTGSAGVVCPASGTGNLNVTVTLPAGGGATFQITVTVAHDASGSITNTVTVALPPGVSDPSPGNNTASDTDVGTRAAHWCGKARRHAATGRCVGVRHPVLHRRIERRPDHRNERSGHRRARSGLRHWLTLAITDRRARWVRHRWRVRRTVRGEHLVHRWRNGDGTPRGEHESRARAGVSDLVHRSSDVPDGRGDSNRCPTQYGDGDDARDAGRRADRA